MTKEYLVICKQTCRLTKAQARPLTAQQALQEKYKADVFKAD
jgi:hypothetical protein